MSKTSFSRKDHWESIYSKKQMEEVSWYQAIPKVSLDLFKKFKIPKDARILDVGGGDGYLVDRLIDLGYKNISVLDISEKALEKAKMRLGAKASKVTWIVSDITQFETDYSFDAWHDRAVFHFLTSPADVRQYVDLVTRSLSKNGWLFMGTFSTEGPTKCSGLDIQQYSEKSLTDLFKSGFVKKECFLQKHSTPFDSLQEFLFCSFQKK